MLSLLLSLWCFAAPTVATLHIGTGISDATGPIADLVMMGMANPSQKGAGLLQRLRARAFVALDDTSGKRFAFINMDTGMGSTVLTNRVIAALESKFPGKYSVENVAISGQHTHSGPSGFLQDVLFQFSGSGWQPHVLDAMVNGAVDSVVSAHNNLTPATASFSVGKVADANINRSPTAYLLNPEAERARYPEGDTDKNMTLLKFTSAQGEELGMFNWFAVHGTSLNNTNLLVSGDNKGHASFLFEQMKNGPTATTRPGTGKFVGAFCSANLGDVSPNTKGAHCRDTGLPCDGIHSTCNNRSQMCSSSGPGKDMYDSCQIIAEKQFEVAKALYTGPTTEALYTGPTTDTGSDIDFVQTFVKMPGRSVSDASGKHLGTLCSAAMGDSFAAGTTDGPGMFDFTQGANSSNPFWHWIVDLIKKPTKQEKACQEPKGILLPTGDLSIPHPWAPDTLSMQILRLGKFIILVVPTELTTMSGRRLRESVKARMVLKGVVGKDAVVVIAGLSNGYADYTATFEEYQEQRYEGGSTIFGPHQLSAYIENFGRLVDAMAAKVKPATDAPPKDFSSKLGSGKAYHTDYYPSGAKHFGQVMVDAKASYTTSQVVSVNFAGGHPQNNVRGHNGTFMEVQKCADATCATYETVAVDSDWSTQIHIKKSKVDIIETARTWQIIWAIPPSTAPGNYRIVHYGTSYDWNIFSKGKFSDYQGTSRVFSVTA